MSGDDVCSSHCAQQSERPPSPDWTSAAAINKWLTDLSWWYQCVLRLDQPPPPVHPSVLVSPVSFSTPIPSPASPVPKRCASVCCLLLGWMMICCCHHVIVSVSVCVGLVVSRAMHCTHIHRCMSCHVTAVQCFDDRQAMLCWCEALSITLHIDVHQIFTVLYCRHFCRYFLKQTIDGCHWYFVGRLWANIGLNEPVSMYVRPYTKSYFELNKIWYVAL